MPQRKLKLPVPLTILTGSLGVGKTTALCRLVAQKPAGEVWCCIVNEFGAVGIDAAAIESSASEHGDVVVKQIAGGCMCCVLSGPLSAAIAQIIRQVKPDRVLIEPSGLGHPGGELLNRTDEWIPKYGSMSAQAKVPVQAASVSCSVHVVSVCMHT